MLVTVLSPIVEMTRQAFPQLPVFALKPVCTMPEVLICIYYVSP